MSTTKHTDTVSAKKPANMRLPGLFFSPSHFLPRQESSAGIVVFRTHHQNGAHVKMFPLFTTGGTMKKVALTLVAVFALSACGGGDDSKDLFSLWKSEQTGAPLDLSGGKFGTDGLISFYTVDGTKCTCDLAIIGDQGSGTVAVTGCISIPYNATKDKQCVAL